MLDLNEMPTKAEMKKALKQATKPSSAMRYVKGVFYGKPKRGKSHFVSTFPKVLVLDFDGDTGVYAALEAAGKFDGRVVTCSSVNDLATWYWILKTQKHPYQTVAIDTLSMLQEVCLQEILGEKAEKRGKSDKDVYHASQQDYGRNSRILRPWITRFVKTLDMHVLLTCHEREDEAPDEEDGEEEATWYVPDLQGAVRSYVCGLVSTIGYAYRVSRDGKLSFRMAFDRPGTWAADRFNRLPRAMKNPSYAKIMQYYQPKGEDVNG